jgi:hypothetical protein
VRATSGQKRAVARVRELGANDALVRFYHYNRAEDTRVPLTALEALAFEHYPAGTALKVFWGGKIWDAKVLRTEGDFHFITYPGWPSYWDEWVLSDRIAAGETPSEPPAAAGSIEVEWRGRWYPAAILKRAGSRTLIHYAGYDASWDEWVPPARIRKR